MNARRPHSSPITLSLCGLAAVFVLIASGCTEEGDTLLVDPGAQPGGGDDPPPPGIDTDGDGLTDLEEFNGWNIAVDFEGYGDASVLHRTVKSNARSSDSDGDGLLDLDEFQLRLDPLSGDTDLDGLRDFDEVFVWLSNAASVDTDGDARGSGGNAPNARLFDGNETRMFCDGNDPGGVCVHLGTSPTLADTDGDGLSDYAEFDDQSRSPLIADLPRIDLDVAGAVDMRLNVEYEESLGQKKEYGSTFTNSETRVQRNTTNWSNTLGASLELATEIGLEGTIATGGVDTKVSAKSTLTFGVHYDLSWGGGDETGTDTTEGTSTSQLQSDERTMTESAASGTISMGLVVRNSGLFSVALEDFGVTVLRYENTGPDLAGTESFKTLATLTPEFPRLSLGPGESSAPIQISSDDVNVDVLKEFLASPSGLVFSPIATKMTAENGIDFDFLTEKTFTQTALVEIDSGGGEGVEAHRIATNVRRGPGGTYRGITMREVLTELLRIPYTTGERLVGGVPTGERILIGLAGRDNSPPVPGQLPEFLWLVQFARADSIPAPDLSDFDEIRLQARDEIRLIAWIDLDQDGLSIAIEDFIGSSDEAGEVADPQDTDADGLTDPEEALEGWLAGWPGGVDPEDGSEPTLSFFGYPKLVVSDPRVADTDEDGLTDDAEKAAGTDPTHVDTDRDGLEDGRDPFALLPARVLRVDADRTGSAGPGLALDWSNAFEHLQDAIQAANDLNGNADGTDDVGEIWVADGTYRPDQGEGQTPGTRAATFMLPRGLSIFGGFASGETKRGQRNPDPFSNGTVLSGDLLNDDETASGFSVDGLDTVDNSFHVVTARDTGSGSNSTLDGFLITGGRADDVLRPEGGGILVDNAAPQLRNLFFFLNQAEVLGGALAIRIPAAGGQPSVENCVFGTNRTKGTSPQGRGGAVFIISESSESMKVRACLFTDNKCASDISQISSQWRPSIGGGLCFFGHSIELTDSHFTNNEAQWGGGVYLDGGMVLRCEFRENRLVQSFVFLTGDIAGGSALMTGVRCPLLFSSLCPPAPAPDGQNGNTLVSHCVFWGNDQPSPVGQAAQPGIRGALTGNREHTHVRSCTFNGNDSVVAIETVSTVANSILWGNAASNQEFNLVSVFTNCCVDSDTETLPGSGNVRTDPSFANAATGNLRIETSSSSIDRGKNLLDFDPITPGFQSAPRGDLDGRRRIVDGDLDGNAVIDMGAYEFQGN